MSTNSSPDVSIGNKASAPSLFFRFLNCDFFSVMFSFTKDNTPVANPDSLSRNNLIATVYKQHITRFKILEPYRRLKTALKNMQDEYSESRDNNAYARYNQMKNMIHEVILAEMQNWKLVQIPSQERLEPSNAYVLKIINLLDEKTLQSQAVKANGIASLFGPKTINVAPSTKYQNLLEKIRAASTEELRKECDRLYIELYKLIRKYLALRQVVLELTQSYHDTRFYPFIVRYPLFKTMIKRLLRAPAFSEICHEINE